jgi:hypothetical protein
MNIGRGGGQRRRTLEIGNPLSREGHTAIARENNIYKIVVTLVEAIGDRLRKKLDKCGPRRDGVQGVEPLQKREVVSKVLQLVDNNVGSIAPPPTKVIIATMGNPTFPSDSTRHVRELYLVRRRIQRPSWQFDRGL